MLMLTVLVLAMLLILPGTASAEITLETVLTGLDNPVRLIAPAGDDRLFVVERTGLVRIFDQDGTARGVFLDVSAETRVVSERGLLGLAFAPDYANSGIFYISYTDDSLTPDSMSLLYRYTVSANPDQADAASAELLLQIYQPDSNHNGGHLEFGPDGMLYLAMGDGGGGGGGDTGNNAQNESSLLGKMLRLDVSAPGLPSIPTDNPFVGQTPRDEIWALGLRNPWTFSFDSLTGDLYIADVGQTKFEEIDIQPVSSAGGENYGWRLMEGNACFNPPTDCNPGALVLPTHEYGHTGATCSISGGYVYRGTALPDEAGAYFFADWCSGQFWSLRWTEGQGLDTVTERTAEFRREFTPSQVASFGQDGHGELYVIENGPGKIHRIIEYSQSPTPSASMGQMKGRW